MTAQAVLDLADPRSDPQAVPVPPPAPLARRFARGGLYRFCLMPEGIRLRHASWRPRMAARGRVLILGGRGEFAEKYATEIVGELLQRGLEAWTLDWRGQGLSDRPLPDREKHHIDDFATYLADLRFFLAEVLAREPALPTVILAHSMGGHLALRHLAEAGEAYPFAGAVLSAPMTGLLRAWLLRLVAAMAIGEVRAQAYLPGMGPFSTTRLRFEHNKVTSDPRRYLFTDLWFEADPRLMLGGITYGWLQAALASTALLFREATLSRIEPPILLLSARRDALVDPASQDRLAARLPACTLLRYEESAHEIMMERDEIRARFWRDVDAFLAGLESGPRRGTGIGPGMEPPPG